MSEIDVQHAEETAPVTGIRALFDRRALLAGAPFLPLLVLFGLRIADDLDAQAFNTLVPDIARSFHLSNAEVLSVASAAAFLPLVAVVPIAYVADRRNRLRMAAAGAVVWGAFSMFTGWAWNIWALFGARAGSGIAKAVNEPTHRSLIADLYPVTVRANVYSAYELALNFGLFIAPLLAGTLAVAFSWRTPFMLFAIPAWVMALVALRLREPVRGRQERLAAGAGEELAAVAERPPTFGEAGRLLWNVRALRRIWYALPFYGVSTYAFNSLISLYYDHNFHANAGVRGAILSGASAATMVGLLLGTPLAQRFVQRGGNAGLRLIALLGVVVGAGVAVLAGMPSLGLAVLMHVSLAVPAALLMPSLYSVISLVTPPRARALGFAYCFLWLIPGFLLLPVVGGISDHYGIRVALALVVAPVYAIGSFIISTAGALVDGDIARVRTSTLAQAEAARARSEGRSKLLICRGVDVGYEGVRVLFGVDFEVADGEMVALLGTNGAGKSTLLRAICGLTPASGGAIIFDGDDITATEPAQAARHGIVLMPGGRGVFPSLTVAENMRMATWLYSGEPQRVRESTEQVLDFFPALRARWNQRAGNLSGGEQQMLSLSQAFVARPRLLLIDELSLGLAPVIVEQLLGIVRAIHAQGTAVVLVEQSVNVALTLAPRAVFLEKGEVRFDGPTAQLLSRDDVLHSVFIEGAVAGLGGAGVR
ncbi:MAG TPA: ATP-binding protein [Candidatus Dormibacteraeota bacterium]|nr:ATP-binding protein [Candidatus Dormibacteraeota bacterium]